jgi:hypothetical protein
MEAKIKRKRKTATINNNQSPVLVYSTAVKHSNQKPLEIEPKNQNPWSGK